MKQAKQLKQAPPAPVRPAKPPRVLDPDELARANGGYEPAGTEANNPL